MREVFLAILLSVQCIPGINQEYEFPLPENVRKKYTISSSILNNFETSDTISQTVYNSSGSISKEIQYLDTFGIIIKHYKYNKENQLISIEEYGRDPARILKSGDKSFRIMWKPDSTLRGRVDFRILDSLRERENTYTYDILTSVSILIKDNRDQILKKTRKSISKSMESVYEEEYQYSGNTRIGYYKLDDELTGFDTTYYENGLMEKRVEYLFGGEKISEIKYKYDSDYRLLEFRYNSTCKSVFGGTIDYCGNIKYVYDYNSDGFLSSQQTYLDGELVSIRTVQYIIE